jgi:hypothetical protein
MSKAGGPDDGTRPPMRNPTAEEQEILMNSSALAHPAEALFTGKPAWRVPGIADRYDYKKKAGDSDGYNTSDEIEV